MKKSIEKQILDLCLLKLNLDKSEKSQFIKDFNNGETDFYDINLSNVEEIIYLIDESLDCEYSDFRKDDILELLNNIDNREDDFYINNNFAEYRFIEKDSIDEIYKETIKQIVEDCYDLNLDDIPSFISFSIDWDKTAENCMIDGFGHTFSSYDGNEYEMANYYVFRVN